jgi:hypothetical protein
MDKVRLSRGSSLVDRFPHSEARLWEQAGHSIFLGRIFTYNSELAAASFLRQDVLKNVSSLLAVLPHRPTPAASGLELGHRHTPPPRDTLSTKLNAQKLDARNQCLAAPTLWTTLERPVEDIDGPAQ